MAISHLVFILFGLSFCWVSLAPEAVQATGSGLALDGSATSYVNGQSSLGVSITMSNPNDIIMVVVFTERHLTRTSASCTPNPVELGQSTECTVVVTDTSPGNVTTPTGLVYFSSAAPQGAFSSSSCSLGGTSGDATCQVSYTLSTPFDGTDWISVTYGGDATHFTSDGPYFYLTIVQAPPSPPSLLDFVKTNRASLVVAAVVAGLGISVLIPRRGKLRRT